MRDDKYEEYLAALPERKAAGENRQDDLKRAERRLLDEHRSAAYLADSAMHPVVRLMVYAGLFELLDKFNRARRWTVRAVAVSAVGALVFAVSVAAAGSRESSAESTASNDPLSSELSLGTLDLLDDTSEMYAETLGESCNLEEIAVRVLNATGEVSDVVVLPDHGCKTGSTRSSARGRISSCKRRTASRM